MELEADDAPGAAALAVKAGLGCCASTELQAESNKVDSRRQHPKGLSARMRPVF
jgi:hypothetical protein